MKKPVALLSGKDAFSAIPVFIRISAIIMNGNSEGRTHSAHSINPFKQQPIYLSGKITIAAPNSVSAIERIMYFNRFFIT